MQAGELHAYKLTGGNTYGSQRQALDRPEEASESRITNMEHILNKHCLKEKQEDRLESVTPVSI